MDIRLETGFDRMDFGAVTAMLARAFWSPGISRDEVEQGARNSALVVGAFAAQGPQVGYARAVSDKTRFAYLMDVYVHEDYRGQGLGRRLVRAVLEDPELRDVYHWLLITKDAHELYRPLGFGELASPASWMEIRLDRPQR